MLAMTFRFSLTCLVVVFWWGDAAVVRGEELTGEQIYRERCAACHGARGEGVADGYPEPISAGRSLAELAQLIAETMPSDAAEKCSGPEAEKVAAYIQDTFLQNAQPGRAPRVELARLTVGQYRHAVAELLASLRGDRRWDERRGLLGSYNTIDEKGDGKHVFERLDPEVKFDFGSSSPQPEQIDPKRFAISWTGSVLAPQTAEYEIIVRSENSFRLYLNNRVEPLVDGWIKSGDGKEFRATISLLGGRAYPLTLHFTKAGQGVRKMDMPGDPIPPASIHLAWKLPGRPEETLTQEYLSPVETQETLVVATSFPPDDRSTGFERGTTVTAEWERATTSAAIEVAEYVRGRLRDFAAVPELNAEHAPQVREFCARFVAGAFRRPLTQEQRALYVDATFESTPDLEAAVERVVLLALKSPRFLYRDVGPADGYRTAARLAFVLWNAPPDAELLTAAADGKLATSEEVAAQTHRMLADPRFEAKLREFLLHWMKLDQPRSLTKDAAAFPEFDAAVEADLRTSLEMFLNEVIRSRPADFRQLLTADSLYLNGRLARIYGVDLPADAPFQKVTMQAADRAGLLSHPYLMASFADTTASSPIRRGVFVARGVLGRTLMPPPDAFAPLPPDLHPDLTTRERVALQTDAAACRSCHNLINPLGFTLERFDAIGRLRSEDNRRPVDASGSYQPRRGDEVKLNGARELANYLVASEETHTALVEKMFYYTVQQPIRAFGPQVHEQLRQQFVAQNFDMRQLMAQIATLAALSTSETTLDSGTPALNSETKE
jgi:mono/diheme cytochrome c family protein